MSIVPAPPIADQTIANRIYVLRSQKVMLDSDLAELYGVTTSALNQQVKRNANRFRMTSPFSSRRRSSV